jgi:hypothetical protein
MLTRCYNPKATHYHRYGGRGIVVCDRWRGEDGLSNFLADLGTPPHPKMSIERRDNNGAYSPDNCYWGTARIQARNRCNSRYIEYEGRHVLLVELAEQVNIPYKELHRRLARGWELQRAVTQPLNATRHSRAAAKHLDTKETT